MVIYKTVINNNYGAIIAPTATDDNTIGYNSGSRWVDTVSGIIYECIDGTTGAAVWDEMIVKKTGGIVNLAGLPIAAAGLAVGDLWNNLGVINIA